MDPYRKAQLDAVNAQVMARWGGKGGKALRETTYRGLSWAAGFGEPTQAQLDAALKTSADAVRPQWVAYNATDENAPADACDVWTVGKIEGETIKDWKFIRGLTQGYAESLAADLNKRDDKLHLMRTMHASMGIER